MGNLTHGNLAKGLATEMRPLVEIRADADLVADMKARLAEEAWTSRRGIWVEAREGTIALIGVVNSDQEKAALARVAGEIKGCKGIENHLLVRSKRRDYGVV
jgi:osmotically-inducible protein OsmY